MKYLRKFLIFPFPPPQFLFPRKKNNPQFDRAEDLTKTYPENGSYQHLNQGIPRAPGPYPPKHQTEVPVSTPSQLTWQPDWCKHRQVGGVKKTTEQTSCCIYVPYMYIYIYVCIHKTVCIYLSTHYLYIYLHTIYVAWCCFLVLTIGNSLEVAAILHLPGLRYRGGL